MTLTPSIFTRHKFLVLLLFVAAVPVGGELGISHRASAKADDTEWLQAQFKYVPKTSLNEYQEFVAANRSTEKRVEITKNQGAK